MVKGRRLRRRTKPSEHRTIRLTVDIFCIQYSSETTSVHPERSRRSGEVEGPQAVGFDFPFDKLRVRSARTVFGGPAVLNVFVIRYEEES
jgi:hypothetical protein